MEVGPDRLVDRLGPDEPPYRSRGEAQIGRLLDRFGFPFVYEQSTIVLDRGGRYRIWHPDFCLPEYNGAIIEYAGMPDVPHYMAGIGRKQMIYRANHIPAIFLFPEDLQGPRWPERAIERVRRLGLPRYSEIGSS